MRQAPKIILVDADSRRRAAITHTLAGGDIHVEPFEYAAELNSHWPRAMAILAHDEDGALQALFTIMTASGSWLPIIAYAQGPATREVVKAVLAGAVDYLALPFGPAEVGAALATAGERGRSVGNVKLREARARSRISRLSDREREVLNGIANGLSNRLIGERLKISPRTVEIHRANMLNKIGATHTSDAIRIAIEASLVR